MKKYLILTLALALLSGAASATLVNNGDGTSTFSAKSSNSYVTGICEQAVKWVGGTHGGPATCDQIVGAGPYSDGKTYVELGVCTQEEADNGDVLETSACTQNLVDNKVCTAEQMANGVIIPHPTKCGAVADWLIKSAEKDRGERGLALLDKQRNPDPIDNDDGEVVDPD